MTITKNWHFYKKSYSKDKILKLKQAGFQVKYYVESHGKKNQYYIFTNKPAVRIKY